MRLRVGFAKIRYWHFYTNYYPSHVLLCTDHVIKYTVIIFLNILNILPFLRGISLQRLHNLRVLHLQAFRRIPFQETLYIRSANSVIRSVNRINK